MHVNRIRLTSTLVALLLVLLPSVPLAQSAVPAAAVTPADAAPPDVVGLEQKIDELVAGHMTANGFSGSILLAREGRPLVAKGYGYANLEWQIPNTTKTRFRIGSITKQFTSMLVMQLREAGKIRLEDSLCRYVTPCPDAWQPVTIHHLLTHTSGIPSYTGMAAWRDVNMMPKSAEQIIAFFKDQPLGWTPGDKYAYNNSGYFLLGVIIEKVTGKKYEQALQELILTPLGLKDTGYDWPQTIVPRRAAGYTGRGDKVKNATFVDMNHPFSAGALYSTVEDLLKWDQALYTEVLLPDAAKQTMWTPFKENYGYGWTIGAPSSDVYGGHKRMMHGGGIQGFSAFFARLPAARTTIVVLANNDTASASAIARDIMAAYYGHKYEVPVVHTVAKVDPAIFDRYVGRYELRPDFVLTISRDGNSLVAQASGQQRFEVLPASDTTFFADTPAITITFETGADGRVSQFVLLQNGQRQVARRIE